MKGRILFIFLLFTATNYCIADTSTKKQLEDNHCAYGSHKELYAFFTDNYYAVIAQGKRIHPSGMIKDFADALFLLSPDMTYFHIVTLSGIKYDYFKACIFNSSREIDFHFASPIPNLLERKNREHFVFLVKNIPKGTACPTENNSCMPWPKWSPLLQQTLLLSAYTYSNDTQNATYDEEVEITLDNKTIRPSRGKLTEHARVKYALRLRNELKESGKDIKAVKDAYIQIHDEVDHKLPLLFISVSEDRSWNIIQVNRMTGLAETIIQGSELELYPMKNSAYKKLLGN
ncbi:MAG: hypothetical protein R8G33_11360 [Gammaproteobacteria bacterium]|nr:hypothetical protein [Gammaproteobacteria bacterium]